MSRITIIGAGPAGLFAAERLAAHGHDVCVFDRMPTPARKFLLAGRGGLNITHSEPATPFRARYAAAADWMTPALEAFPPADLIAWCEALGQPVFTGSSGRVFPTEMKAAPLLRAWLRRLAAAGVRLATRHHWRGWTDAGALLFETPDGQITDQPDATLLALGGASWPRMGSDGGWVGLLRARGIPVADLRASNCGVRVAWSDIFRNRFEGAPLKRIAITIAGQTVRGEAVITRDGLEGGALYALSAPIRAALDAHGVADLHIDLRPDLDAARIAQLVGGHRRARSLSNILRQSAGLSPVAIGLVQEALHAGAAPDLATLIKHLPVQAVAMQGLSRAISSAGGVARDALDANLMLRALPGVFVAGEMIDWEAPTGGYLLQGCFSTGALAAEGIRKSLLFFRKEGLA